MNIFERMKLNQESFSKTESKIYHYINDYPEMIERYTIIQFAEAIHVSKSAVMRFCQKIGYSGYSEFRFDYIKYAHSESIENENSSLKDAALSLFISAIKDMSNIEEASFINLAKKIATASVVRAIGSGKSSLPAQKMQYNFARFAKSVEVVDNIVIMRDLAKFTKAKDLLIYFSVSAEIEYTPESIKMSHEIGATVVLITCNAKAKIAKYVDQLFLLPKVGKSQEMLLDNHALMLIFVDILLTYYVKYCISE